MRSILLQARYRNRHSNMLLHTFPFTITFPDTDTDTDTFTE